MFYRVVLIGVLANILNLGSAQQAAPPSGIISTAHISPTLYFFSPSEELASRNALHARVVPLVKKLAGSDKNSLEKTLDTANQTLIDLQRHAAYLTEWLPAHVVLLRLLAGLRDSSRVNASRWCDPAAFPKRPRSSGHSQCSR